MRLHSTRMETCPRCGHGLGGRRWLACPKCGRDLAVWTRGQGSCPADEDETAGEGFAAPARLDGKATFEA